MLLNWRVRLYAGIIAVIILSAGYAFSEEVKSEEPIVCNGDRIEYMEGSKKLKGTGNIIINYQDMKLSADKVEVNMETKEAYATGNVVLMQSTSTFKAESILYNFEKKTGKLSKGRMISPPWYGQCDEINKVGDKEYILGTGYMSTCDHIPPHYKIRTKNVKVYLGDRIEAKNVVVCAGNVPILYLPAYTQNVMSKKPMISVVPGHSKEWGYYNLAALRYILSEDEQGKLLFDIRSKKGIGSGITHNYNLGFLGPKGDTEYTGLGKGIINMYYINEDEKDRPDVTQSHMQRYRAQVRHKWQMDENTQMMAEYNKLSDKDFTRDYFYRQEYINEIQPKTYVYLSNANSSYSTGLFYQNRINPFFTETEYKPEAMLDIKNQRLFEKMPFYFKGQFSAAGLATKTANSSIGSSANRLDGFNELSYTFSPVESLAVKPYVGTRQTWYSRDINGDENKERSIFYSGVDTSTRFYRTFDVEKKFAGVEIHGLRHIVTPIVKYKYVDQPTITSSDLVNFDDIDTIKRDDRFTLSLENYFQTKKIVKAPDEPGQYDTLDLARVVLSTDYKLRDTSGQAFSNIIGNFEVRPSQKFLMESNISFNPYSTKFDIANLDFVTNRPDGTKIGLGQRYQRAVSNETTFQADFPLTSKIGLHCYERYQFSEHDLKEQEYGVTYDLHCWVVDLFLNSGNGSTFWVIFRLKAFPDFPIQLGTTYESPKPEPITN